MYLTKLKLANFKNYGEVNVSFDQKVNIVYGENGSGKTNFLDAIHFLSVSKSYFGMSDKYLIRDDNDFYRLEGFYREQEKKSHLIIKYKMDQTREIHINRKKLARVNDLIGKFPIVLIAPDDISIVKGSSKERRDYYNKWLCQSDGDYLNALMMYNRLLRQKDALLKGDHTPDPLEIEAFNHRMIPLATQLHSGILQALTSFIPVAHELYRIISEGNDSIAVNYLSDLTNENIAQLFERMIPAEINARRPLVGIQRDDYEFLIEDRPFKKYGSQGQIKSLLYSLRLAEFAYIREKLDLMPILVLDDFFEKLDNRRLSALLSLINSPDFGQVFLSDTELARSKAIFNDRGINFAAYHVEKGRIYREA